MLYKPSTLFSVAYCVLSSVAVVAQSKLTKNYAVANTVVINLNASHTDVVFETWNKNSVEIKAFLEGENQYTPEERERILKNWQVSTTATKNEVTINSAANTIADKVPLAANTNPNSNAEQLKVFAPMITEMLRPIMNTIATHATPNMSQEVIQTNASLSYTKKDEKYVQQWEEQIQKMFGKPKNQSTWSTQLDLSVVPSNDLITMSVQTQGKNEVWQEEFGKKMEAWASQFAKEVTSVTTNGNVTVYRLRNAKKLPKVHKIIKVKMPTTANVVLNMRHGTVQLAEHSTNIKGVLSHTKLSANVIKGAETYIKAAYAPVDIKEWKDGRLVIKYVKNCRIKKASNLLANTDSSSIYIQQLDHNGAISGNFGAVTIASLGVSFKALDIAVKNSDVTIASPTGAFRINYNGVQSRVALPKSVLVNVRKNFGNVFINGYQTTRDTESVITVNAKYSDIILQ